MDDEQKQNLVKKRMHNTEANVDQSNIVIYDPREGFLPVWWHNVYGTRSTAMVIQNVTPNNSPAVASYGPNTVATQTVQNVAPSYDPMPRTSDAGTSNQSRNMQTESTLNPPIANPKTCDAGS
ncbi:uncharacterized protein [Nicotiana tomentosiformis]|uniref:uncharacterized protein n=1 Tax=Nicotiana tomentosiformis TaxID=4098 RepID=UPI00051B7B0B|nr:uncharacterized protein LOC104091231 [Nicotiana tomentosiformis]